MANPAETPSKGETLEQAQIRVMRQIADGPPVNMVEGQSHMKITKNDDTVVEGTYQGWDGNGMKVDDTVVDWREIKSVSN